MGERARTTRKKKNDNHHSASSSCSSLPSPSSPTVNVDTTDDTADSSAVNPSNRERRRNRTQSNHIRSHRIYDMSGITYTMLQPYIHSNVTYIQGKHIDVNHVHIERYVSICIDYVHKNKTTLTSYLSTPHTLCQLCTYISTQIKPKVDDAFNNEKSPHTRSQSHQMVTSNHGDYEVDSNQHYINPLQMLYCIAAVIHRCICIHPLQGASADTHSRGVESHGESHSNDVAKEIYSTVNEYFIKQQSKKVSTSQHEYATNNLLNLQCHIIRNARQKRQWYDTCKCSVTNQSTPSASSSQTSGNTTPCNFQLPCNYTTCIIWHTLIIYTHDALTIYTPPEPVREDESINDVSQSIEFFTQSLGVNTNMERSKNEDTAEEDERPVRRKPDKYAVHALLQSIHRRWYDST